MSAHTPGPWSVGREYGAEQLRPEIQILRKVTYVEGVEPTTYIVGHVTYPTTTGNTVGAEERRSNARLIAAAPDMLETLHEGRRAIGDHFAPNDCYATGPLTGDNYRDLVQCPACSFIAMYDAAIAKATGEAP